MVLSREFYLRPDVLEVARDLLGKHLYTRIGGKTTSGIIIETEAYAGVGDRASHAFGGRRTARTEIMYAQGGTSYVYLCYGIHSLFNVVTNAKDIPHAVLIRGIVPAEGPDVMAVRTKGGMIGKNPGTGPGKVSRLLGIHFCHTGMDLTVVPGETGTDAIWLEDRGLSVTGPEIEAAPRVGVDYAGADALLPYRFRIKKKPGTRPGFL